MFGVLSFPVYPDSVDILIAISGAEECTRTSLISPEEAPGDHGKLFPGSDCNVSKGIDGVNLFCSDGGKRRSARLHDIKACLQRKQAASGGISMASESCDVEGSRSPTTPIQSQTRSEYSVDDCKLFTFSLIHVLHLFDVLSFPFYPISI